jgi:thioredoxin 1
MATHALSKKEFDQTIDKHPIVLIDWWAEWCGPCRSFAPVYEQASDAHADVYFAKVDTEAEPELAGEFQIRSIPTLMAFRDGILVFAQAGMLPPAALEELLEKIKTLDMNEVRRAVEEQEKNAPTQEEFDSEE